jgi:hypothetical protein
MIDLQLNEEEYQDVKKAFFNIFSFFLDTEPESVEFHDCIYKWGIQLGVGKDVLDFFVSEPSTIKFEKPDTRLKALEQVYDLVYMIYLDGIVEDVELKVASKFAQSLGFEEYIVGELLKSIVTAPYDGISGREVRKELHNFLDESIS